MSRATRPLAVVVLLALGAASQPAAQEPSSSAAFLPADVEPAVVQHVRGAERQVGELVARGERGSRLADAYGELARVYHAYEIADAAEAAYRRAIELTPRDARWPHLLGYLFEQTGRAADAVDPLQKARALVDATTVLDARLGAVYLTLDQLREAREQFERVRDALPALAAAGLGEVALREQRWDAAVRHFEFALARVPEADALHYSLAMAYRGLGRLEDARRHLARRGDGIIRLADPVVDALEALPRGERALVVRGRRAFDAGRYREAAAAFRQAIDVHPTSAVAHANLAAALTQLGDRAGARAQFEAALALDAEEPTARRGLGLLLLAEGKRPEALVHLRAALRSAADDESLAVSVAVLLADLQQYREAVAVLEDAHQRPGDRTASATTLARLLAASPEQSLRDGRRALELAEGVYDAAPSPAHAETVALALAELGRCAEALAWMTRAVEAAGGAEAARLRAEMPNYEGAACRR